MPERGFRTLLVAALIAFAGVLVAGVLTRPRLISNDSFNYVDVARNIAAGRGITQSALGYNAARFPVEGGWPAPFTAQPPLYPLTVAALIRLGLEPVRAALLVPLLALIAIWILGYRLTRDLWGRETALAALGLLVLSALLPGIGERAWSETLAIALALFSVWLEAWSLAGDVETRRSSRLVLAAAAGLAAGAAFSTRYLFAIALPVGLVPWILHPRRGAAPALAFVLGFALPAVPVIARNASLTGSWLGETHNFSPTPLSEVLGRSVATLAGSGMRAGFTLFALVLALVLLVLLRRRAGSRQELARLFLPGGRGLVVLWPLAYCVALAAVRSFVQFDTIGLRLLSPALVFALVLGGAVMAGALAPSARLLRVALLALALGGAAVGTLRLSHTPPVTPEERIARSARLAWVRDHVRPGDLVVGDDAVDLPLWFRGADGAPLRVACLSPAPYMSPLTEADLFAFARRHARSPGAAALDSGGPPGAARSGAVYLVLRRREAGEAEWRALFGPFIADLATGRAAAHPRIVVVATLADALVFRIGPARTAGRSGGTDG
jgi:4-amino-4-deoxy-L-arabinose transferase-like glycosyltransferase